MELALIIGVVGLVFMGMQVYVKRGIQGKIKDVTDSVLSSTQSAGDPGPEWTKSGSDSSITATEAKGGVRTYVGTESSSSDPGPVVTTD